jgi:hypothetical protein
MAPWYASIPDDEWDVEGDEEIENIRKKFEGNYGDRRQEIVFIGIGLKKDEIILSLDECLLNEFEMISHSLHYEQGVYYDPLPAWTETIDEPQVLSVVLRPKQSFKFTLEDGMQAILSNLAITFNPSLLSSDNQHSISSTDEEIARNKKLTSFFETSARPAFRIWLHQEQTHGDDDYETNSNKVKPRASLISTLRFESCEQHSISLCLPHSSVDDDDAPSMTFTLSMEPDVYSSNFVGSRKREYGDDDGCKTIFSFPADIMKCFEVHVIGTVKRVVNVVSDHEEEEEEEKECNHIAKGENHSDHDCPMEEEGDEEEE